MMPIFYKLYFYLEFIIFFILQIVFNFKCLWLYFFTVIKFTEHKPPTLTILKYTSHWFISIFTTLCSHHHHLLPEYFLHIKKETHILDISYKRDYIRHCLCVWLLSFSIKSSRLMYVVAHVSTSFLFTAKNMTFYEYTTFYFLFISSYIIEFFPWIKMLQTFMYTCFYSNICFSSLGICLKGELLGHMVILCLKFWGIAKQIFTGLYYFTHLPETYYGSNFSVSLSILAIFLVFVPWTARRSNQSILKEISPGCSLEGLMLKPPHAKTWFIGKDSDAGRDWGQEEKGTTEDERAGWHHRLDGHEFE